MKKLDQIRKESKEIKDKINDTEERLRQLKIKKRRYWNKTWRKEEKKVLASSIDYQVELY